MKLFIRMVLLFFGLVLLWQSIIFIFKLPAFILPPPKDVLWVLWKYRYLIMINSVPTILETLLGLLLGIIFGCFAACLMAFVRPLSLWFLPVLIISQAIPTFAIAPLLVIWFGYGISSKIITTIIMLFFPITSAFYDGLKTTPQQWLELAKIMQGKPWRIFWNVRIPAALPHLAAGVRIAAVIAPLGAIVGEWVGASKGLGFLMLNANARMQIDLMFAVLFTIVVFSLTLYFSLDKSLNRLIPKRKGI